MKMQMQMKTGPLVERSRFLTLNAPTKFLLPATRSW